MKSVWMQRIIRFVLGSSLALGGIGWVAKASTASPQEEGRTGGETTRVSVASDGNEANGRSSNPSLSADGRHVAFTSFASNLVPGDTNGGYDVFVHDRETGETTRVSVASDGMQANSGSSNPSISACGRYVAFDSHASNLVPGDTNGIWDVFVYDRETGETTRVSVASDGSQGNGYSQHPSISSGGRHVAFISWASNLVPGDTNEVNDVFVHDRATGETIRVSVASDGAQANGESHNPSISADGRHVAFTSFASNLVPGDTNGGYDVFVHDRETGETTRVSVASDGTEANYGSHYPSISADGRYVAFDSDASNLVPGDTNWHTDVFVHDRETGETTRVSVASDGTEANSGSSHPSISVDGQYVAFTSWASNLVPGDWNDTIDVFLYDRETGETTRVSVASEGTEANDGSLNPSISAGGHYVAFGSDASNLVPEDTNETMDVFVHGPTISVGESPEAGFTFSPSVLLVGEEVQFTNTTVGTEPITFQWDFGDGAASDEQNPSHTYSEAGTFIVTLTATNNYGSDWAEAVIVVVDLPSEENLVLELSVEPSPVLLGEPATFTAVVTNNGEVTVEGVMASGEMPDQVVLVGHSAECDFTDGWLTCDLGDIQPGESKSAWVTVIFNAAGPFEIGLQAWIPGVDPVTYTIPVLVYDRIFLPLINHR
jgi:uncharacterized repeat protein (TIGR01451 family)